MSEEQQPASIITQVSTDQGQVFLDPFAQGLGYSNTLRLDLRGTVIELSRQELSQLPESILLGISNGLSTDANGNIMVSMGDVEVASVNFAPECLQYTLDVFREAAKELPPVSSDDSEPLTPTTEGDSGNIEELLRTKPAIIVLREDLDYYCLPPRKDISVEEMNTIKRACGQKLVELNRVFTGLERGDNSGVAEQHLIDMLCSSGFSTDERWGVRAMEPNKTVVSSLALVRLKPSDDEVSANDQSEDIKSLNALEINSPDSPIATPNLSSPQNDSEVVDKPILESSEPNPGPPSASSPTEKLEVNPPASSSSSSVSSASSSSEVQDEGVYDDSDHGEQFGHPEDDMVRSHKLLLFWRKPARKCWWNVVTLDDIPGVDGPVRVHVRSVWTLELSVIDYE